MPLQYGGTLGGNQLTAIQTAVGSGGLLRIYSSAAAAHPGSTEPTGLLATITLPATFITVTAGTTSAAAFTTISGSWTVAASGGGAGTNALSFRIYDSAATTCHLAGTVTATGGGGDLQLNNVSIATGQTVTVTAFSITQGNW
jgi:hypothetical protein